MEVLQGKKKPRDKYDQRDCQSCEIKDGVLYHNTEKKRVKLTQMGIPLKLQEEAVRLVHDSIVRYHMGTTRTVEKISNSF